MDIERVMINKAKQSLCLLDTAVHPITICMCVLLAKQSRRWHQCRQTALPSVTGLSNCPSHRMKGQACSYVCHFSCCPKAMSEIKGQLTALLCKTPHDECGELQWPSSVLQYYIILNSSPVFTAVWVTACFDQRSLPICAMTNLRCPPFFGLQRSPFGPSSFKSLMDTAPMAHLFVQTFLVWWWIVHLCVVLLPSSRYYVCPVASLFSLSCYECSRNSAVCASNNTSNWAK